MAAEREDKGDAPSPTQEHQGSAQPLKPSEVLERAAALIEPEGAWTQVALAENASGREVRPTDTDAVCWCAAGAIARARGNGDGDAYSNEIVELVMRAIPREYRRGQIWEWNDDRRRDRRNQLRIVEGLRKAADLARSEGQ